MKALIDPESIVQECIGWELNPNPTGQKYIGVIVTIPNALRVSEIVAQEFPVAPPFFWVDCADNVVADQWYYDTQTTQIIQIPPAPPYPQQSTQGLQTV